MGPEEKRARESFYVVIAICSLAGLCLVVTVVGLVRHVLNLG